VQTYPVQSVQGATILLCGHENGVTLVWRGGRRLKAPKKQQKQQATSGARNGNTDDSVMIIDSDDEAPAKPNPATKFEDKPEFEDEVQDGPYPEVVQTLDLALGTAVLKVAVMPMTPTSASEAATRGGAKMLSERMVFAVSCVTNDVYVITLPLTPPSHESKARLELRNDLLAGKAGSGAWGESLVLLGGQRKYSQGLAITLAAAEKSKPSHVVVASHTREATGVLRLWNVELNPSARAAERPIEPFQTEYLPKPLTSISFNPTHTTQLLAVSSPHGVRIYDYALPSIPPDPEAPGPYPAQGSWLLTLYQPFARPTSTRKPVLDAAWITHGRAVFALLADGMWGIWDVDGVGPSSAAGAALSTKLKPGVRGAALAVFSVHGYVEGTSALRTATQQKESSNGEFAPMTPHTRRQAAASLSTGATLDQLATIHGGVRVMALSTQGKGLQDESVAFWIGSLEHVCVIPGVARFWDSQLRKGAGGGVNLFSGAQPTRIVKLMDLGTGLLGERCCGVGLVADLENHGSGTDRGGGQDGGGLPVDVIVRGETRMVVVREGQDEGPGKKIGGVVSARRKRLFSKGGQANAIIVHGSQGNNKVSGVSFNLSTAKPGSLRQRPSCPSQEDGAGDADMSQDTLPPPARTRGDGFEFSNTLNAAADMTDEFSRDVEAEVLDIMEIDQALDSMADTRGNGRKRVFFEED
jgi:hypothetical protein